MSSMRLAPCRLCACVGALLVLVGTVYMLADGLWPRQRHARMDFRERVMHAVRYVDSLVEGPRAADSAGARGPSVDLGLSAASAATAATSARSSQFTSTIPLVYAWFRADIKKDAENRTVWDTNVPMKVDEHFYWVLGASLLHTPAVVLLTDPSVEATLVEIFPPSMMARLHIYDYLTYCDDKVWRLKHAYEAHIKQVRGKIEPFEKMNELWLHHGQKLKSKGPNHAIRLPWGG